MTNFEGTIYIVQEAPERPSGTYAVCLAHKQATESEQGELSLLTSNGEVLYAPVVESVPQEDLPELPVIENLRRAYDLYSTVHMLQRERSQTLDMLTGAIDEFNEIMAQFLQAELSPAEEEHAHDNTRTAAEQLDTNSDHSDASSEAVSAE